MEATGNDVVDIEIPDDDFREGEFEEGQSLEDLADQPMIEEPPLPGTVQQLSFDVGGESPTSSTLKLRGGSIPVEGIYKKGDTIQLIVSARISEIAFVDKIDASGYVTATERRQLARIESARRA